MKSIMRLLGEESAKKKSKRFGLFGDRLFQEMPNLYLWSASVRSEAKPICLEEVKLTTTLRSPPLIVREVMEAREIQFKEVDGYTESEVPIPTDGPAIRRIADCKGQLGHVGRFPHDCVECGFQVASVLTELGVGLTGAAKGPPPLQCRDVFILFRGHPTEDKMESNGRVISTANSLVKVCVHVTCLYLYWRQVTRPPFVTRH